MSDNTTLPGTGDVIALEDRGGVKFQHVLVATSDSAAVDAFGRFRVSNPKTLFDSKLLHGDGQVLLWDEELESGTMATAGPTAARPFIDFTSTNIIAGQRTRQTFQRFNYQPGKAIKVLMTGVLELASGVKTGCERRIGLFDNDNGAFFESDAGTVGVTIRTNDTGSPVDTTVVQTSWNLDTMDGGDDASNPSGVTLDITKAQIFIIDYQWLSVGRVRFGVEIAGVIHYVHQFVSANVQTIPWTATPNLPLRYQIITTTSSGVCSMRCICATVISEGGGEDTGVIHYRSTQGASVDTAVENTLYALVGIRLKSTHLGANIHSLAANLQVHTGSEFIEWCLVHGSKSDPITVGGSFTYTNLSNSAVQTALGATANTVTGGTIIGGGYVETGGGQSSQGSTTSSLVSTLGLGAAVDGTRSEVILGARPIGGVSVATIEGSLTWREIT